MKLENTKNFVSNKFTHAHIKRRFFAFKAEDGFTLLELIVSMAVTSFIALIIASGFSLTVRAWEKGEESTIADQHARIILSKISKEIASIYIYRYKKNVNPQEAGDLSPDQVQNLNINKKIIAFNGKVNSIDFISTTGRVESNELLTGLKKVSFSIGNNEENGKSLLFEEQNFNPGNPLKKSTKDVRVYSNNIRTLQFRYYLVMKEVNTITGKDIYTSKWVTEYKEEVETSNSTVNENLSKVETVLRGVEVAISVFEKNEDGSVSADKYVDYPPIIIPVNMNIVKKA